MKKLKRVCLYIETLGAGGAERQLVTLAKTLNSGGLEILVLCDRLDKEHGHYLPILTQAGIPTEVVSSQENLELGLTFIQKKPERCASLAELPLDHAAVLCLVGCLLRVSPDILHCYLDKSNCLGGCAALCAGVPGILLSARNTIPANLDYYAELAVWAQPVYKFLLQHPQVMLEANSSAGARDYADWLHIAYDHVAVTPNGLDIEEFHRQQTLASAAIRSSLGISRDAKLVVWVGKDTAVKRPLDMLAVAAHVCKKLPQARFAVLGNGMDSAKFARTMRRHALDNAVLFFLDSAIPKAFRCRHALDDAVLFLGRREDALSLISASDALLLTSSIEGFPNAIMEAMYAQLPVVATEVGGIPDLVTHGTHGFLHQVGDVGGMAHSLLRVLCNPVQAKKMGQLGADRVRNEFSATRLGKRVKTIYSMLLQSMPA